jgi:hypothetical protein
MVKFLEKTPVTHKRKRKTKVGIKIPITFMAPKKLYTPVEVAMTWKGI